MGEQLKRSVQFRRDLEEGSMTIFQLLQLLWNDLTDAPTDRKFDLKIILFTNHAILSHIKFGLWTLTISF